MNTSLRLGLALLLVFLCFVSAYPLRADVIYVDANATGANNGSNWTDAYKYLQDALIETDSGDSVLVAQGTYRPDMDTAHPGGTNDRTATFQLKNGVAIYGGFPTGGGSRDPNIYQTILSGDIGIADNNDDNSYHVVTGSGTDSTAILDGFTITQGYANGPSDYAGAGMYNSYGSPKVTNCTFIGNSANIAYNSYGGGMFNYYSSPTLTNCAFVDNSVSSSYGSSYGGGLYNEYSNPTLTNCTFIGNSSQYYGGGMCNYYSSNPTVTNCAFIGNSANSYNGYGGGMYNFSYSNPTVTNCSFTGNSVNGIYGSGGGMCNDYSSPVLTNCILWGNTATTGPQIYNASSTATVSFSDIQGGWTGTGNIDADPLFVDADGPDNIFGTEDDNLRLSPGSPCIDAGDNTAVPVGVETDLDGLPRFIDDPCTIDTGNGTPPIVDMGAFEYQSPPPGQVSDPSPANLATDVNLFPILTWTAGDSATSHDVYFGTTNPPLFQGNQAGTTYDPGPLNAGTHYFWRIDEKNFNGTTTGIIWQFTTTFSPGQASNPSPANLATDVNLSPILGWTAGDGATSHDVYFGAANPPPFQVNQAGTTYDPGQLNAGSTYYWRIDEKNAGGVTAGALWSFTTVPPPPGQASNPSPAHQATDVSLTPTLSWTAGSGATSHLVYFGTNPTPGAGEFKGEQTDTTYAPGTLLTSTTYYWRIDEKNAGGTTTGIVWNFTTVPPPPGQASNPTPSNGATNVSRTQDLSWTAGSGVATRDVYFGTVNPPVTKVIADGTALTYDTGTMATSTTYYWRVDEKNAGGTTTGDIWSFTTVPPPPGQASNPSPANLATDVNITPVLIWTAGPNATSHRVYFGTSSPGTYRGEQTSTSYDPPETLTYNMTYYWRIDEKNSYGTTTGIIWMFTTKNPAYIYVDANATGANNGSSWADAYKYLQNALTASDSGTDIWVAQGTYQPGYFLMATFQLKNGVEIYGGFPSGGGLWESRDPNTYKTILSGDIGVPNDTNDNIFHVVTGSGTGSTAIIDGFTITAGNADSTIYEDTDVGGGMYNNSGSPIVTNCTFSGNSALGCGGGMYNNSSSPTLTNCTFIGNSSDYGGGMYNNSYSIPTLTNCTFTNNSALNGGGMENSNSDPNITNCTFTGNSGGGIYNQSNSSPTVTNCTFTGNSGAGMSNSYSDPNITNCTFSGNGCGIFNDDSRPTVTKCTFSDNSAGSGGGMYNNYSDPNITNCTFSGNSATYYGGGMDNHSCSPTITNCVFRGNSADSKGGGMYNHVNGNPMVTNCTFIGNSAGRGGGMNSYNNSDPTVTNCTFIGNSALYYGGGMCNESDSDPKLTNCTFTSNSAHYGGGISNIIRGNPTLTNCIFSDNSADYGGGISNKDSSSPTVTNCILWSNTAPTGPQIYNDTSSPAISFSDVQGGWAGAGNINANPLFVDANGPDNIFGTADDNVRLSPGSPCIDEGNNTSVPADIADLDGDTNTTEPTPLDLDLRPRFVDGDCNGMATVDMGAYEFTYAYIGDFDSDCEVDFTDFSIQAGFWKTDEFLVDIAPTPAGDGIVDIYDLSVLCDNWLETF